MNDCRTCPARVSTGSQVVPRRGSLSRTPAEEVRTLLLSGKGPPPCSRGARPPACVLQATGQDVHTRLQNGEWRQNAHSGHPCIQMDTSKERTNVPHGNTMEHPVRGRQACQQVLAS